MALYGLACAATSLAADCRYVLADQSNYSQKLGFYLNLENTSASGPCKLNTLTLALGVAGNNTWRFAVQQPVWQVNTEYKVTAVIASGSAELWMNDILLSRMSAPLTQFSGPFTGGTVPSWASASTGYVIVQTGLSIASTSGQKSALDFKAAAQRPAGLIALAPGSPQSGAWLRDSGSWTLTANFHFVDLAEALRAPLFDRYLQSADAQWPTKIQADSDLTSSIASEDEKFRAWGTVDSFDSYGGLLNAGWKVSPAKGFFQVAQHDGRWWLISPTGNPQFYIGLDTAPSLNWDCTPVTGRTGLFAELPPATGPNGAEIFRQNAWGDTGTAYTCFNTVNLIRKYGPDWKAKSNDRLIQRIKAWGFSGLGKWSDMTGTLPILPVLNRTGVPLLARHPDVFDPAVQTTFRNVMAAQLNPGLQDPRIVGYTMGSEYDEIVTTDEIPAILSKPAATPAKRALIDEALRGLYSNTLQSLAAAWKLSGTATIEDVYNRTPSPPAADIEYLRRFYARAYYQFIYKTFKSIDPNHLYLGNWIVPYWWVNDEDWRMIAANCDVIGYDRYATEFADDALAKLIAETGKPILAGEFSFPAHYNLSRGFRAYDPAARDDADSGALYTRWLQQAVSNPNCVGVAWFQYRDEPVSGRGPGNGPDPVFGEDFAFGLVDVGDRPKLDLVEAVRSANLTAAKRRLTAPQPALADGGVVNAATFLKGGPVAAGGLMTIFGTGLDAVSLKMGGYDVPVLYASPNQINAQVPWELAGTTSAPINIPGSNAITVPLAPFAPGIFAVSAAAGNLTIYATGLGPVDHQPATGAASPDSLLAPTTTRPNVTVGGAAAIVTYSGLAPGWIGLYQVNAQVPPGIPSGAQPVRLAIGGIASNEWSITLP